MNTVALISWVLVTLGPVLAYGAFHFVRRRPRFGGIKGALGAAALAGLLWFVLITDWLPAAWKSFWSGHSITAGVISTALGAAAAWMFIDVRTRHQRNAALYGNWSNWLRGQTNPLTELIKDIEAVPDRMPAYGQLLLAARTRADLLVQQQWVASTYTVFLLRAADDDKDLKSESGLMNGLGTIRRHGANAIRELTELEMILQRLGDAPLPSADSAQLWKRSLIALINLREGLTSHEEFVSASRFDAAALAGQHG